MPEAFLVIKESLPYLLGGAGVTAAAVVGAMLFGLLIGVNIAVLQVYGPRFLARLAGFYVWFFRGVPVLVLLFLFYFGLFSLMGVNLSAFSAVILVLGMTSGAYQSQIYRGAIESLPFGQLKAARALGMSDAKAITTIILPQALRLSIPGFSNEYSIILKDSALAFVLGTSEIMARTHFVASRTYQHLPLYVTAGILYFILTWLGVKALRRLEEKARIPGYSHHHG
jgi:polar amino acid transport system permease protein